MAGEVVLVVEDNEINMELATDLLEAKGYEVIQAATAEKGIERARTKKPILILMDIGLPGMDGLTATGVLKNDPETSHIPVVAMTAHAMKGDEDEALGAGCLGYIAKPIDTRSFSAAVADFIDKDR
jgi:CheY-like chemotaxis protein